MKNILKYQVRDPLGQCVPKRQVVWVQTVFYVLTYPNQIEELIPSDSRRRDLILFNFQVSCRFGVSSRYLPVNEFWNSGAHGPFEAAFQEKPEICPASKNNDSVATPIQPFVVALSVLLPLLLVRVEQIMFCPRLSNKLFHSFKAASTDGARDLIISKTTNVVFV